MVALRKGEGTNVLPQDLTPQKQGTNYGTLEYDEKANFDIVAMDEDPGLTMGGGMLSMMMDGATNHEQC